MPKRLTLTGAVPITVLMTDRLDGHGHRPFESNNVSELVGDNPEVVAANRSALARRLGVPLDRLVFMRQIHGREVAIVDLTRDGRVRLDRPLEVDAMVTASAGVALAAMAADCIPVALADPAHAVVGVAHAGRRGVELGVVSATVEAMRRLGADPARIVAWLGPAVCGSCYEVPADLQAAVAAVVPETRCLTDAGTPGLELRAGVVAQLQGAGVAEVHIDSRCTVESSELFSYRRDRGVTGRQAVIVMIGTAS